MGNALRFSGGVSDLMIPNLATRYIIDSLYFVLVLIILTNVIFGIVIDTFGDLREKKEARLDDTVNKCFICGIEKQIFDRASDGTAGFRDHITSDHNMWNYLYFIIYIWEQDKDDDDGLEQFVRRCIATKDIQWFPMNQAMCLEVDVSAEEILVEELKQSIANVENRIISKIAQFKQEGSETLKNVVEMLQEITGAVEAAEDEREKTAMKHNLLAEAHSFELISDLVLAHPPDSSDNEENKEEDNSQVSAAISIDIPGYWKILSLSLLDVSGMLLLEKDIVTVSVRVLCDTGMFSVKSVSHTSDKIVFDNSCNVICPQAKMDDMRTCKIQILSGIGRVAQFVGVVEVSFDELIAAAGLVLEKTFIQSGNPKPCTLAFLPVAEDIQIVQEEGVEEEDTSSLEDD